MEVLMWQQLYGQQYMLNLNHNVLIRNWYSSIHIALAVIWPCRLSQCWRRDLECVRIKTFLWLITGYQFLTNSLNKLIFWCSTVSLVCLNLHRNCICFQLKPVKLCSQLHILESFNFHFRCEFWCIRWSVILMSHLVMFCLS